MTFLRLKLLELLYHVQDEQTVFEENHGYLPKILTEKIEHVKDHMLQNTDERPGLKALAEAHDISLTQLKVGFKQIYRESPAPICAATKCTERPNCCWKRISRSEPLLWNWVIRIPANLLRHSVQS